MDKNISNINSELLISVSTIVKDSTEALTSFMKDVDEVLKLNYKHYEIVLIDNGSSQENLKIIKKLINSYKNIRLVILSKENDEEIAFTAALENCIGDFVIIMYLGTDPPYLIPKLVETCNLGFDYVVAESKNQQDSPIHFRVFAWIFYKLFNTLTHQTIDMRWSNFSCMSRKMVNAITQVKDRIRYLKFLKTEIGYPHSIIKYDPIHRIEKTQKKLFWNRLKFAIETIVSSSDRLIRTATLLAFFVSFLNFCYIIYALFINIFKKDVAHGWTSTSIILSTMFGTLFFILAIFGEYISIVFKETKKGPLYHIADEINSTGFFDKFNKPNVK